MKKLASWYTIERWRKPTEEEALFFKEEFGQKPCKIICKSDNGFLFSMGHYPTKIAAGDLPPSYIRARIGKLFGYYDSASVIGAAYKPNLWINHLFRDDSLLLSFSKEEIGPDSWDDADVILSGWDIVSAIAALSIHSAIPETRISTLENEVASKVRTYQKTHPDEHDRIEEDYYWETLEREKRKIACNRK